MILPVGQVISTGPAEPDSEGEPEAEVEEPMLVGETLVVHFDPHGQVVAAESVKSAY